MRYSNILKYALVAMVILVVGLSFLIAYVRRSDTAIALSRHIRNRDHAWIANADLEPVAFVGSASPDPGDELAMRARKLLSDKGGIAGSALANKNEWSILEYTVLVSDSATLNSVIDALQRTSGGVVEFPSQQVDRAVVLAATQGSREKIRILSKLFAGRPPDVQLQKALVRTAFGLGSEPVPTGVVSAEVVKELVDVGVDLSIDTDVGVSALSAAAYFADVEIVSMIIDKWPSEVGKIGSTNGWTPLHWCFAATNEWESTTQNASEKRRRVAELLIQSGADESVKDKMGRRPVDLK